MKQEELTSHSVPYGSTPYKEVCTNCGKEYVLFTQKDDDPEYYTDVYILCKCGEYVEFSLPVN